MLRNLKKLIMNTSAVLMAFTASLGMMPMVAHADTEFKYVIDNAGVLSQFTENELANKSKEIYAESGYRIAVITDSELFDDSASSYYPTLYTEGMDAEKGIVFLIGSDGTAKIEVSKYMQEELPQSKTGAILDESAMPYFEKGEVEKGIVAGYDAINAKVEEIKAEKSKNGFFRISANTYLLMFASFLVCIIVAKLPLRYLMLYKDDEAKVAAARWLKRATCGLLIYKFVEQMQIAMKYLGIIMPDEIPNLILFIALCLVGYFIVTLVALAIYDKAPKSKAAKAIAAFWFDLYYNTSLEKYVAGTKRNRND